MSGRSEFASSSHHTDTVPTRRLDPASFALAERLAFDYGESYDSYLLLDEGREHFFDSSGKGVISFVRWRKHAYVVGGLITPQQNKRRLLRAFLEFAARERLRPLFIGVLASDLPLFQERGMPISKIGEEPIIDLPSTDWSGRRYSWVRRQENSCLKGGVRVREIVPRPACPEYRDRVVPELLDVSNEHLQATVYGRELAVMVGRFRPLEMHRKRLFIAVRDGRIEAFVVATPAYRGQYWAVETYRRRQDACRGVTTCLIMQISRQLRAEGIPYLSLCQVPGLRHKRTAFSDSDFIRDVLSLWWNHSSWLYDPSRLYHFKSRFRPHYRELYITGVEPRILPMLAFGFKWGVIWPDFRQLPKQMIRRIKKWGHKEQLADPWQEEYTLVNRLSFDERSPLDVSATHPAESPAYELSSA